MTPPAATPATGAARRHTGSHGYGLVLFASVVLVLAGHRQRTGPGAT